MIDPLIASSPLTRHLEVDVVEERYATRRAAKRVDHVDDDGVLRARVRSDVRLIFVLELLFQARRALAQALVVVLAADHRDRDAGTLARAPRSDVAARCLEREAVVND